MKREKKVQSPFAQYKGGFAFCIWLAQTHTNPLRDCTVRQLNKTSGKKRCETKRKEQKQQQTNKKKVTL